MEKVNFDEYPIVNPVNRTNDQLAAFAARHNNTLYGVSNGKRKSNSK